MGRVNILFADNNQDFLATYKEKLENAGYDVIPASNSVEARRALMKGNIDLAILDVRLEDDLDSGDTSGIAIALEVARMTPKIILTDFPTLDSIRAVFKHRLDGLPSAVAYVDKREGFECLVEKIEEALGTELVWMRKVKAALSDTNETLKIDQEDARRQANLNFFISLAFAVLGAIIILGGFVLAYLKLIQFEWATTAGGVVAEAIAFLFFRRVDSANQRMDRIHAESISGQRFETLLRACDAINSQTQRNACLAQLIQGAKAAWLGGQEQPLPEPREKPETV